jgi:uncharacterized protein
MKLKIAAIPNKTPMKQDFDCKDEWYSKLIDSAEDFKKSERMPQESTCQLEFVKQDDCVHMKGKIEGELSLNCSRCAKKFTFSLLRKFSQTFVLDPKKVQLAGPDFFRETENDDIDVTFMDSDEIDLQEVISEQVFLERPFQPLCSEDCKGLCLKCGVDLNTASCDCLSNEKRTGTLYEALKDFKVDTLQG